MIKLHAPIAFASLAGLILAAGFALSPAPARAVVDGCCEYRVDPTAATNAYAPMTDAQCDQTVKVKFYPGFVPDAGKPPTSCIAQPDLGDSTPKISNPLDNPVLSVGIPGLSLKPSTCTATECSTPWLGDYINGLYKYGITAIALLAVIGLMIGGLLWVSSAGNDERVGDARKWIGGSLMGVLISLTAYTVLNIINPALTQLSPIKISNIEQKLLVDEKPDEEGSNAGGSIDADTSNCPQGVTTPEKLADYYTKQKTLYYSQASRGDCVGGKCYCDCSSFGDLLSTCSGLKKVGGEGTSAGLWANSRKIKITVEDCEHPRLKPGDAIVKVDGGGHVLTYVGNGKLVECGGGSKAGLLIRNGAIKLSDWKTKCLNYLVPKNAYYISR